MRKRECVRKRRRKRGQVNVPPGPEDSEGEEEGSSKRGTRVDGDGHPPRAGREGKGMKANSRHPAPERYDQRRNEEEVRKRREKKIKKRRVEEEERWWW